MNATVSLRSQLTSWWRTTRSKRKTGALSISQSIDEGIIEHEDAGNDEVVDVLKELKSTAFGIYLRIKRCDEELMGDREGKYSGYFATEE